MVNALAVALAALVHQAPGMCEVPTRVTEVPTKTRVATIVGHENPTYIDEPRYGSDHFGGCVKAFFGGVISCPWADSAMTSMLVVERPLDA